MTYNELKEITKVNLEIRGNKKRIRCVETGIMWNSIIDIAREFDLPYVSFATCVRKYGKYGKYHFEYVD